MNEIAQEIGFDPELLFDRFLNLGQRDPATVPQTWKWSFHDANGQLTWDQVQPLQRRVCDIMRVEEDHVQLNLEPIADTPGNHCSLDYQGVMQLDQLKSIHDVNFEFVTQQNQRDKQFEYMGVLCFADDLSLDADERYLIESVVMGVDWNEPRQYVFMLEWTNGFDEQRLNELIPRLASVLQVDESQGQTLNVEVELGDESDMKEPALIRIIYSGPMTVHRLRELHELFGQECEEMNGVYHGVFVDEIERQLTVHEMAEWTENVLAQTTPTSLENFSDGGEQMRTIHLEAATSLGLTAADWMPLAGQRFDLQKVRLRSKDEIIRRMMAAYISTAWVCAPAEYVSKSDIQNYLKVNQLRKRDFSNRELSWLQQTRGKAAEDAGRAGWALENIWALAWLVGFEPIVNVDDHQIDESVSTSLRQDWFQDLKQTRDGLLEIGELRSVEKVLALEDLFYCFHNAMRNAQNVMVGGVMQERRQSLTWALSPEIPWDDTDVST